MQRERVRIAYANSFVIVLFNYKALRVSQLLLKSLKKNLYDLYTCYLAVGEIHFFDK